MTMLRVLAAALAAAFAFAAGSAQAEMKREWVEYGHGDTKLKSLHGLRRPGQRQASSRADDPCARRHDAEDAAARRDLGQARLRGVRGRHFRLRPGRAAEGRPRNAGADRDLHQGPAAPARTHASEVAHAPDKA